MATQSITISVPHGEAFSAAKAAAASIFKLIERKPLIDSLSNAGLTPRRVKGDISLEDVHFSYPSRPDVKVSFNFRCVLGNGVPTKYIHFIYFRLRFDC